MRWIRHQQCAIHLPWQSGVDELHGTISTGYITDFVLRYDVFFDGERLCNRLVDDTCRLFYGLVFVDVQNNEQVVDKIFL